jgi:hypothetical protein
MKCRDVLSSKPHENVNLFFLLWSESVEIEFEGIKAFELEINLPFTAFLRIYVIVTLVELEDFDA